MTSRLLHEAVQRGDLAELGRLLQADRSLANARSETDFRGPFPLHVAAEAGQTAAAQLLLEHGADVGLRCTENWAIALGWAAFFGRPDIVQALLVAGSDPSHRNRHGLTPLGCALGGVEGRWQRFSNATTADWQRAADLIRARGGSE